ncbi:MAG: hypothetical protein ABI658_23945 [Acidimicrobiales bacterium]
MTAAQRAARAMRLLPPTGWGLTGAFSAAPRPTSFEGMTLGLLANSKANSAAILDSVAAALARRHRIAGVVRASKAHPSLPVSEDVLAMFAQHVQVVLTAIGD